MTITARAREIVTQTDALVVQTVRFFNNAVFVKDAQVQYAPGSDQASAIANLTAVVRGILTRLAADGSSVAVTPATMLDLTDPVVQPPAATACGLRGMANEVGHLSQARSLA